MGSRQPSEYKAFYVKTKEIVSSGAIEMRLSSFFARVKNHEIESLKAVEPGTGFSAGAYCYVFAVWHGSEGSNVIEISYMAQEKAAALHRLWCRFLSTGNYSTEDDEGLVRRLVGKELRDLGIQEEKVRLAEGFG